MRQVRYVNRNAPPYPKRDKGTVPNYPIIPGRANVTGPIRSGELFDMTKDELIAYVSGEYSTDAEYPWGDDNGWVVRHTGNRKWFAVGMSVPYRSLGIPRDGTADVVDVKCGPVLMGAYRGLPGVLPGYHMNKENWVSILLDGSAEDGLIKEMLEISYTLTDSARKAGRGPGRPDKPAGGE